MNISTRAPEKASVMLAHFQLVNGTLTSAHWHVTGCSSSTCHSTCYIA